MQARCNRVWPGPDRCRRSGSDRDRNPTCRRGTQRGPIRPAPHRCRFRVWASLAPVPDRRRPAPAGPSSVNRMFQVAQVIGETQQPGFFTEYSARCRPQVFVGRHESAGQRSLSFEREDRPPAHFTAFGEGSRYLARCGRWTSIQRSTSDFNQIRPMDSLAAGGGKPTCLVRASARCRETPSIDAISGVATSSSCTNPVYSGGCSRATTDVLLL